jgi:hypothetical protein
MKVSYSDLILHLPIRPRVAFVLAIAERVLPALAKNGEAFKAARKAVTDAWRWEEGEKISAIQLYEEDDEALALQTCLIKDKEGSAAINAATSAFYYTLWRAFTLDLSRGQVREGEIPGMRDVTEEVIDEVCELATQTSLCDSDWILSLSERLASDFRTHNPEELGTSVPRQFFK